ELENVKLFHLRPFGRFKDRYLEQGMEKHVKCATAFAGGIQPIVQLIKEGKAEFYPIPLSKIPWLFREGPYRPDIFITTVSPPDRHGYCSLGVSVDYAWAALETARIIIAEVNENMPRTCGDSFIHLSRIDYLVEVSEPIYEIPPTNITNVERRIGENVASLVEDEATIQIGYGGVSEAITSFLKEKKDLGMHTEMVPEGTITLVEEGALTCEKKSIHKRRIVCTFNAGTRRLYDWLDKNPIIEMKPVDYTNDSKVIAMNHKMTAINTALQIDLYGNIYSDMLGLDQYSGAGGQPDFVLGALLCPNGKSIIVLPSTAAKGKVSRIVAHPILSRNIKAPLMPTVTRFYADYVVTEWGVASLKDKTISERAKALIEIAHPDFKDELWEEARKINLVT
ncbi:TPA: acetyl-CoA hydrolase/transferase family protein, partial [Candidatus Bathyarchaeota archaeon]|nr:acetyl-CoA hydrolase/transferase family protein [Candidatus Bathyarchaeota archaeon]